MEGHGRFSLWTCFWHGILWRPQQWGRMADALSTENVTVVNVAIHIQMWSRTVTEQLQRSTSVTLLVWNGYDRALWPEMQLLSDIWHIYGIYHMAYIIRLMLSEGLVVCLTFPGHLTWCCGFDQVAPWHEAPVRSKSCQGYPCYVSAKKQRVLPWPERFLKGFFLELQPQGSETEDLSWLWGKELWTDGTLPSKEEIVNVSVMQGCVLQSWRA